jgi:hemoglobin
MASLVAQVDREHSKEEPVGEPTLYERLGGIFAIAAVVDHFSDQLLQNSKVVEANPELKDGTRRTIRRGCRASSS